MALIKCKECGKEISDSVKSCPHCGYVYKKTKEMTTMKVVKIIIIVALVGIALLFGFTYLFFDYIPKIKVDNEMKKYYGEWELVDENYGNVAKMFNAEYKLKKQLVIDRSNIESQAGNYGCGFNKPQNGYAITSYKESGCSNEYYLITSLDNIVEGTTTDYPLENVLICFELKDKTLTQIKCGLDDNSAAKNEKITYKLK